MLDDAPKRLVSGAIRSFHAKAQRRRKSAKKADCLCVFFAPLREKALNLHKLINLFHRPQPRRQRPLHPRRPLRQMLPREMNTSLARDCCSEVAEANKRPGAA